MNECLLAANSYRRYGGFSEFLKAEYLIIEGGDA
jgi:hypothetical protein